MTDQKDGQRVGLGRGRVAEGAISAFHACMKLTPFKKSKVHEEEIHNQAPGRAPVILSKRERRKYTNKGVKTMMEKSTETAESSSWKLRNSRPTAVEPPWD